MHTSLSTVMINNSICSVTICNMLTEAYSAWNMSVCAYVH